MISVEDFYRAYETMLGYGPDDEQKSALEERPESSLFIVAGPGTGKTTCLTLRILKLVLVDGIPPRGILATTFTKKAAAELRSRILGWGFGLLETLGKEERISKEARGWLSRLDINQVVTGTIDSICERVLREYRDPGTQPPILADDFVSKTLLLREGMFPDGRFKDPDLGDLLLRLHGGGGWGFHVGRKNTLVQNIWDRRFQDQVEWSAFVTDASGGSDEDARETLGEVVEDYKRALDDRGMVDFALLEQKVLGRLRANQLAEFTDEIEVMLVDEYQDTNLLQEAVYFEMAKSCNGALTVVGDDDQSLYRFRGATVELFSDFAGRYEGAFGREPKTVFLTTNYRSTRNVVSFVNEYATLDAAYREVRVAEKPELSHGPTAEAGTPVLGMFREDQDTLARDLANFIHEVFKGKGYPLDADSSIASHPDGGDLGDCALLCSSPRDYNASGNPRLPLLLRQELEERGVQVFNPRGQDLTEIPLVARFGGLLLECLDPAGVIEAQTSGLNQDMTATFGQWRAEAIEFAESAEKDLLDFAVGWADRDPKRNGFQWPRSVSVLELIYGLVHYFSDLYDDPEGQIYLEVFTRQLSACEQVGKFSGRVVTDRKNSGLSDASVKELLRDFLGPITAGAVGVNEELMDAFPRDRLSVLSIHQAKGLEFPLTIVDAGSDFKTNAHAHAFKRFPNDGGTSQTLEDLLRPYTDLGAPSRSSRDRAFDDLYRQFFVAYSRPQQVLLLVGLNKTFPTGNIKNVATGWDRNGSNHWQQHMPFVEI